MGASADALNIAFNIIMILGLAGAFWWVVRWERRRDHRAVGRPVDRFAQPEPDSIELSRTLIEIRRRLADRYAEGFVDGMHGPGPGEQPPASPTLRAVP